MGEHLDLRTHAALVIDDFQCTSGQHRRDVLSNHRTLLGHTEREKHEIERGKNDRQSLGLHDQVTSLFEDVGRATAVDWLVLWPTSCTLPLHR